MTILPSLPAGRDSGLRRIKGIYLLIIRVCSDQKIGRDQTIDHQERAKFFAAFSLHRGRKGGTGKRLGDSLPERIGLVFCTFAGSIRRWRAQRLIDLLIDSFCCLLNNGLAVGGFDVMFSLLADSLAPTPYASLIQDS